MTVNPERDGDADLADLIQELMRRIDVLEEREGDRGRLAEGVERLAQETGGLNSVLTKVDEQQQALSRLGRDLKRVEKNTVSVDQIEATKKQQEAEALEFRKQTLKRIYTTTAAITVVALLAFGFVIEYQAHQKRNSIQVCEARNEQNRVIVDILEGSLENAPSGSRSAQNVREGIERFRSLIVDCKRTFK